MRFLSLICMIWVICNTEGCTGCGDHQYENNRSPNFETKKKEISAASLPHTGKTVVKMVKDHGIYKVPVIINGYEMEFFFDTGAGMISMSEIEAAFLLKHGKIDKDDMLGTQNFENAMGETHKTAIVNLKEVSIAGKTVYNIQASIVPNSSAPLLLGQTLLSKFGKISIDYERSEITFE